MTESDPRAFLPQVEIVLSRPELTPLVSRISRPLAARVVAEALGELRESLGKGEKRGGGDIAAEAFRACAEALERTAARSLRKVLNGTGVVLHTNLGRSPLSRMAWDRAEAVNTGYSNLEFDLGTGGRGGRGGLAPELLRLLAGAEAALVVNNNAAAVLLALSALASGREVLVSRGEAVQIGGGFRIPDILALSGARLREVGTTNVTKTEDYLAALGPETAAVLLVHSSNFAIRGFAEKPRLSELAAKLPAGLPIAVDQGTGRTIEDRGAEDGVAALCSRGAGLVCFSGDKLLGGPQAGCIVGKKALVDTCARHPLMRAMRPGKTVLSLLEAALVERLGAAPGGSGEASAALRALGRAGGGAARLEALGTRLVAALPEGSASLEPSRATLGGGTAPDETIESRALVLRHRISAQALERSLRAAPLPLIARIEEGRVVVDLAALAEEDPQLTAASLRFGLSAEGEP